VTGRGYAQITRADYPFPDFETTAFFTEVPEGGIVTELTVRLNLPEAIRQHRIWDPRGWVPKTGPARDGITARALRSVSLKELWSEGHRALAQASPPDDPALLGVFDHRVNRGGRHRRTDLEKAQLAAAYVRQAKVGGKVLNRLSEEVNLSVETVRSYLKSLRAEGFLTASDIRGRAGGTLTDKSKVLLKGAKK
jgi:predicted transcriptional regulator